ncbi:MAG: DUF3800 domain-containing protein [candidate division Zixibacteria bacterium]|nr:DUF3800 domain-containing protein [candidate division Zixibacteria bacterium]
MRFYMDESGDSTGFTSPRSSSTFNIALVKVAGPNQIRAICKRFCAAQISAGWPKDTEIKASLLFGASKNRDIPSSYRHKDRPQDQTMLLLDKLSRADMEIDYLTIKKQNVYRNLKTAPPFVLYNFLSGKLIELNLGDYADIDLYYDERNKEIRPKLNFQSYVTTIVYTKTKFESVAFKMYPCDSAANYCIRIADFVSWSVFRKFEYGDSRFLDILAPKIKHGEAWFQGG